jgi:uncharacterized protein
MRIPVSDAPGGAWLMVRVVTRASRTALAGVIGEGADAAVKIALQAPPVEGRANEALVEFLAGLLDVRRSGISIVAGEHGRNKIVLVRGRSANEVAAAMENALAG